MDRGRGDNSELKLPNSAVSSRGGPEVSGIVSEGLLKREPVRFLKSFGTKAALSSDVRAPSAPKSARIPENLLILVCIPTSAHSSR